MNPHRPTDLLELYLLGELSADDARAVEEWLRQDPAGPEALVAARELLCRLDTLLRSPAGTDQLADRVVAALGHPAPRRRSISRKTLAWTSGLAAAACLLVALAVTWRNAERPDPAVPALTGWRVLPTGAAEYRLLAGNRVRLDRGELLAEITEGEDPARPELTVETSAGNVTATGERFYVACHDFKTPRTNGGIMNRLTRVLVLSGVVTLTTTLGTVTGPAGHLLAAETDKPPVNLAVAANSDFAFDLYARLARDHADKNLFFSPYSVSSALAMVAEGARGETADQMGKVLRFPAAARRVGDDAQLIPWNAALIHTGMATLNDRFNGADKVVPKEVREKVATLRKQLQAANRAAEESMKANQFDAYEAEARKSQRLAAELNQLLSQIDQYELRVANALWGEKTYPFQKSYLDTVNKYYRTGGLFPVDFRNDFERARQRINAWVEGQTHDRIKDLIPADVLDEDAKKLVRLILTNAIYFKGEWAEVFSEKLTKDEDFFLSGGGKVRVPMMVKADMHSARYAAFAAGGAPFDTPARYNPNGDDDKKLYPDDRGFTVLELPYKGDELSMVLIAPRTAGGLADVEKALTAKNLQAWIAKLQQREVHTFVPKFKAETKYDMGDTLKAMGMARAFKDPRLADGAQFDGMSQSDDPSQKLYITKVLHKAFVEVSEKGTEAAAATAVILAEPTAAPVTVPFTPVFRADRPFVFLIRDRKTGSVLFLGRMMNPKTGA